MFRTAYAEGQNSHVRDRDRPPDTWHHAGMDASHPIAGISPSDGAALAAVAEHNARMLDLFALGGTGGPAPHGRLPSRSEILRDAARAVAAMTDAGVEITPDGYLADAVAAASGDVAPTARVRRTYAPELVSAYLAELRMAGARTAAGIDGFAEAAGLAHLARDERGEAGA